MLLMEVACVWVGGSRLALNTEKRLPYKGQQPFRGIHMLYVAGKNGLCHSARCLLVLSQWQLILAKMKRKQRVAEKTRVE